MAERLEHRLTRLTEALSLTDEQQSQIRTLMEEMHAQRTAGDVPDRQARRSGRDAFHEQLKAVLTEAQIQQFEEHLEAGRQRMGHRPGRGR